MIKCGRQGRGLSGSQNLGAAVPQGSFTFFLLSLLLIFLALGRLNQRGDPKAGAGPLQRWRLWGTAAGAVLPQKGLGGLPEQQAFTADLQVVTAKRGLVQFISFYRTSDTFKDADIESFATSYIASFQSPTSKEQGCKSHRQEVLKRPGRARI